MKDSKFHQARWVLASMVGIIGRNKKKTAFFVFLALVYAAWKNKEKFPYQKVASKVLGKIMKVMDQRMQHQKFIQAHNEMLLQALNGIDQNRLILNLNLKYSNLFSFEALRNQIRNGVNTLSQQEKIQLWQNIINELIHFTFFTLIVTRQAITLHTIRHVLAAKYRNDFYSLLKDSSSSGIGILNDILQQACDDILQSSLQPTLDYIRGQINHELKSTTKMDFQDTAKALKQIISSLFSVESRKSVRKLSTTQLTSHKDRNIQKLFQDAQDPSFDSPSMISKILDFARSLGQKILPNMYPEQLRLCPPDQGFTLLSSIFQLNQIESISEMNSNMIISRVFSVYQNRLESQLRNKAGNYKLEDDEDEEEKSITDNSIDLASQIQKIQQNQQYSNFEEKEQMTQRIEKSKVLCSLVLKELRDILATNSIHNYFYFCCNLDLRSFLNRLLLLLEKKKELNTKQTFAKISSYFDKLISEEFLGEDSEKHNKEFYEVRIKKCFNLIKSLKQEQNPSSDQEQKALPPSSTGEQSTENSAIFNSQDLQNQPLNTRIDLLIHLNILQEIEQSNIIEDSLKELTKRIFYEREQTTVEMDTPAQQKQSEATESPLDLMSLLSGGNSIGQGGDLMNLLSKI